MTTHPFPTITLGALTLACALSLSACATTGADSSVASKTPDPVTPTTLYALTSQSDTHAINLRIEPQGLSPNQRRALDQVAAKASWTSGEPVDVEIVTSGDPTARSAGQGVHQYLTGHDVAAESLIQRSAPDQPADIITVNIISYTAQTYDCGQDIGNLSATGSNKTPSNFGCAVTSNLAAQIADPRDLSRPATATPSDAIRKSVVLDHYSKGEVTTTTSSEDAKGTISDAIK